MFHLSMLAELLVKTNPEKFGRGDAFKSQACSATPEGFPGDSWPAGDLETIELGERAADFGRVLLGIEHAV